MTILEKEIFRLNDYDSKSFITKKRAVEILDTAPEFKKELLKVSGYNDKVLEVLKIGNAKQLIDAIEIIDSQCVKIDIISKIKDVRLHKLLESEKALFEIFSIDNNFILKNNKSDVLEAETRYDAKTDILDYYNFSKFANYCRDLEYEDLVGVIKKYLQSKNVDNNEQRKLRLLYKNDDRKFFIRALTSIQDYKNFGVNFSVFVALMALGKYVESSKNEVFIDNFSVDDSAVYVSFSFLGDTVIDNNMSLSFSLILENDEIKRSAVSFNGMFKLNITREKRTSEIYIKPRGLRKTDNSYPVDLLNYQHRGTVNNVFEKLQDLPKLIDHFINQVSSDAKRISTITHPDDVRKFIGDKVKFSKKPEFRQYKDKIFRKLMSVSVDNTFKLFDLLREVEELFEHDDIVSLNFWRTKLYEALVERN